MAAPDSVSAQQLIRLQQENARLQAQNEQLLTEQAALQAHQGELEADKRQLQTEKGQLQAEKELLQQELKEIKRVVFGQKRERFVPTAPPNQLSLDLGAGSGAPAVLVHQTVHYGPQC